jgi:hypothetical protein
MSGAPPLSWRAGILMALLLGSVVGLQAVRERTIGTATVTAEDLLYVQSPDAMKRMALSYDSLLADIYWIRTVQYYGGTRLSGEATNRYTLLYPLLDLTTSLEPRFNVAYYFGSTFLAEEPPGGPGRPDLAIRLLEKGLREQPDKWEFAQAIGFVHYWWLHDYLEAGEWFTRASKFPGAPFWLTTIAATTLAEGGSRASSRLLWQQLQRSAPTEALRDEASRRLLQLDAMDHIDQMRRLVETYRQRTGQEPAGWADLGRAGYIPGIPVDPTGVPYRLEGGMVTLGDGSRLFPLPSEPQRLVR